MAKKKPKKPLDPDVRPKRAPSHVMEAFNKNYVEKVFLKAKCSAFKPEDYGYDLLVATFDAKDQYESGFLYVQLKAVDDPKCFYVKIERAHYNLWSSELSPVILVLYHTKTNKAYYHYAQKYFEAHRIKKGSLRVHFDPSSKLNSAAVKRFVKEKNRVMNLHRGNAPLRRDI